MISRVGPSLIALVLIAACGVGTAPATALPSPLATPVTATRSPIPSSPGSPTPSPIPSTPTASEPPATSTAVLSPEQAIARVVAFVEDPTLTRDFKAEGPEHGARGDFYDVFGTHVHASVDAASGTVVSLLFMDSASPSPHKPTRDDAIAAAEAYLVAHGILFDGMDRSVEYMDHGETWEYVVTWVRHAGNVTLPDSREIGVDQSGHVCRYANYSQPYGSIPVPQIDQAAAEAAAIKIAFEKPSGVRVDSAELRLTVVSGVQRLVWSIQVTAPLDVGGHSEMADHAWVEVDAITGEATVVGRG